MRSETPWDAVVVGGGPSGMIAAGRAAEQGCRVLLLEKNRRLGEKLLITGGGRCNVTNATADRHALTARYGERGKHMHSIFARFTPEDMRALLRRFDVETKVEAENRVFPVSDSAASVHAALKRYMQAGGVTVRSATPVAAIEPDPLTVRTVRGEAIRAHTCILAVGGSSRPETGSTGEGFEWLRALGQQVRESESALVPVVVDDKWVHRLQGLALEDAGLHVESLGPGAAPGTQPRGAGAAPGTQPRGPGAAPRGKSLEPGAANQSKRARPAVRDRSVWGNAKRTMSRRGKLLFTHFGLSGPLALNAAEGISDLSQESPIRLVIDLLPGRDQAELDRHFRQAADENGKRGVRRVLTELVPDRLVAPVCELAETDPTGKLATLGRKQRGALVETLKAMPCSFATLMGRDKAVVSSGGLDPSAIDFRTMRLRDYPNIAVLGDMLDFNRQSGGYSLQICWASGWVAGESCARAGAGVGW